MIASPPHPARQQGFALLIVLWSLVLLSLLGSTVTASGRSETRMARNMLDAALAESAADGAIQVAVFHLADAAPGRWVSDAAPYSVRVGAAQVMVSLHDQRGKIDPNAAPPALLTALLKDSGIDGGTASRAAAAVVDWRSTNDGGLSGDYVGRRRFGPPHEAFQSLDELTLVAFVTPRIAAVLRSHASLFLDQLPDPAHADGAVTTAMADATRTSQLIGADGGDPGPPVIAITAVAQSGGARFIRRALVRLSASQGKVFQMLEWSQGEPG